ncbi:MAG: hypothetical protein DHS20C11_25910 [Lysobacteraceae bacterium]|nr:MAG: hypothetical protein DHS20C11_25910 [Xanthomonadaceae bacterium]
MHRYPEKQTAWSQSVHRQWEGLAMHRHRHAYLALVEQGCYREYSADGVFDLVEHVAILHPSRHAHGNWFESCNARVLNFDLQHVSTALPDHCRAYRLSRCAFRAVAESEDSDQIIDILLNAKAIDPSNPGSKLTTEMSDALRDDSKQSVAALARRLGVSHAHASRRFKGETGMTPIAFRNEHRLRRALRELANGLSAAQVAADCGYADQAHLCRSIKATTKDHRRTLA